MRPYNPRGIYWPRESKRGPRFDARILSLRESGLSLQDIANLLSIEFDDATISKNIVHGRATRLRRQAGEDERAKRSAVEDRKDSLA